MRSYGDIMFTEAVKAEQNRWGSRKAYERQEARPAPEGLGEIEAAFIAGRDSFYMATISETGWPYLQHRGGPAGFLKLLSPTQLGFADYRGNKQYISTGNLAVTDRAALFLMDYPNQRRLKIVAEAAVQTAEEAPELAKALETPGQGHVERVYTFNVTAFNWNCPQYITPRFTTDELAEGTRVLLERYAALEQENASLKQRLAALSPRT